MRQVIHLLAGATVAAEIEGLLVGAPEGAEAVEFLGKDVGAGDTQELLEKGLAWLDFIQGRHFEGERDGVFGGRRGADGCEVLIRWLQLTEPFHKSVVGFVVHYRFPAVVIGIRGFLEERYDIGGFHFCLRGLAIFWPSNFRRRGLKGLLYVG